MSKILAIIRRDFCKVTSNAIAIVVCIGLAVMPSFYAWFNIAGGWDPYGNTANLKVALANSDEGFQSKLLPADLNIGESVVADLTESTKIDYVVTSEQDAIEGVRSGAYYAAIVFPPDFSESLMSVLSDDAQSAHITYYSNEKRNAIASIVTEKASTSVRKTIDATFTESLTAVGASMLDDLSSYLDDDQTVRLVGNLTSALDGTGTLMRRSSENVRSYAGLIGSVGALLDSSNGLLSESTRSMLDGAGLLRQTAGGVRTVDAALSGATGSVNAALQQSRGSFDDVQAALDRAYDTADGQADAVIDAVGDVRTTVASRRAAVADMRDRVAQVNDIVSGLGIPGVNLDGLVAQLDAALASIDRLDAGLATAVDRLESGQADAAQDRAQIATLISDASSATDQVKSDYEKNVAASLGTLATSIDNAAGSVGSISSSLGTTLDSLRQTTASTKSDLESLRTSLLAAADELDRSAQKVDDLRTSLAYAAASGDMQQIRTIIGSDPSALAAFVAAPVQLNRHAIYPVENNGSAMAPYYTAMSLWVGGTLMGCVVSARPSRRALEETGAEPRHAYFGRLAYFLAIGFCQSTIVLLGDLFFLGIQCEHPLLFLIAGWCASCAFINIIYSLTVSFGDIGKAIAVLFMVLQVAGSGGTFPPEMLPGIFQRLYPFLPFVHAETAMRACIAGIYGSEYAVSVAKLLAFLAPALMLGLVLRKPVESVNEWFERKLESTRLM